MHHTVFGIRTHQWGTAEHEQYNRLLQATAPENIFIIVDETNGTVNIPEYINKVAWNHAFMTQNNLLDYKHFHRPIGWLCGDYAFYAFSQHVSAQYYWLIEPDVMINFDDIHQFFQSFEAYNSDGLVPNLRKLTENDYWHNSSQLIYEDAHGCLFPFVRLSHRAIAACLQERQRLSHFYRDINKLSNTDNTFHVHFPNDESLVVNTILREHFTLTDVSTIHPNAFDYLTFEHPFGPIDTADSAFKNNVIHPVRRQEHIIDDIAKQIIDQLNTITLPTIAAKDIDSVAALVGAQVIAHLHETFIENIKKNAPFRHLKQRVRHVLDAFQTTQQLWVYNGDTLVLDHHQDNHTHTIEWTTTDETYNCFVFSRTSKEWTTLFSNRYPDLPWVGEKLHLFQLHKNEYHQLDDAIRMACSLFFTQI